MKSLIQGICGLLAAILATTAVWVAGSTAFYPLTTIDVAHGKRIFRDRCASCHATSATAQVALGPSLADIGAVAATRDADLSAEEFLLESIVEPAKARAKGTGGVMPADVAQGLDREEVVSVVAYLASLGGEVRPSELVNLVDRVPVIEAHAPAEIDFRAVERGKKLFATKGDCQKCHAISSIPTATLLAPSLVRAGQHSADYLRESITEPNKEITPGYASAMLMLIDGMVVTGRLLAESNEWVELAVATDTGVKIERIVQDDIEPWEEGDEPAPQSAMPTNYHETLSAAEIDDLVTFLQSLKY